jgi:hypothetical protein
MLQFVTAAGQKFADSTEQVINDNASYGPVGTTMALLEASSKFFSAVHQRLHAAQRDELKILARINYESMTDEYPYEVVSGDGKLFKSDFDGRVDIIPVSDPNVPSAAHRMMMAQMALQLSQQAPAGMYDVEELHKTILRAAQIPNLDKIIPEKVQAQPLDPVSDIMAATKGLPIKAFTGQDHDAHIKVKMVYMQDPENGANPIMQRIVPILAANIQEHSVMKYQEQMNGMTKQMLQGQEGVSPEVVEQTMAQAAQQVLIANQQAAKSPPSPEEQMVMLEAERIKQKNREIDLQVKKEAVDSALENRSLDIKEKQLALDAYIEGAKHLMQADENEKNRNAKQIQDVINMLTKLAQQDADLDFKKGKEVLDIMQSQMKGNSYDQ